MANADLMCPICCAELNDGTQVEALPCGHPMHQECLDEYAKATGVAKAIMKCPVCRNSPEPAAAAARPALPPSPVSSTSTLMFGETLIGGDDSDNEQLVASDEPVALDLASDEPVAGEADNEPERPRDAGVIVTGKAKGKAKGKATAKATAKAKGKAAGKCNANDHAKGKAKAKSSTGNAKPKAKSGKGKAKGSSDSRAAEGTDPVAPEATDPVAEAPEATDQAAAATIGQVAETLVPDEFTQCFLCGNECPKKQWNCISKNRDEWKCSACSVTRTVLYRGGVFPNLSFQTEDERHAFWQQAQSLETSGKLMLAKQTIQSKITTESEETMEGGSFWPLSYWERLGLDADRIARCSPPECIREDAVLGTTYKVVVLSDNKKRKLENVLQDDATLSPEDQVSSTAASSSGGGAGLSGLSIQQLIAREKMQKQQEKQDVKEKLKLVGAATRPAEAMLKALAKIKADIKVDKLPAALMQANPLVRWSIKPFLVVE